jgi:hypothetical protein
VANAFEPRREAAAYLVLPDEALPPALGPSRGFEDAVLREVRHDRVEVMLVEAV